VYPIFNRKFEITQENSGYFFADCQFDVDSDLKIGVIIQAVGVSDGTAFIYQAEVKISFWKSLEMHIMIIAGEASGDLHGAELVKAMLKKNPALSFSGIGGEKLKDAGVCLIADASTLSVVGITEVFSKLPGIFKGMAAVKFSKGWQQSKNF